MAKAKKKGVWIATLYRFGYDLTVVGETEEECRNAMSEEYIKAFDGFDPDDEECREYYECAMSEMYCRFMEFGNVKWC